MSHQRADLINALQKAATHAEQLRLVGELEAYDRRVAAARQADLDIDLADATIRQTLSPVLTHSMHSIDTDWIGEESGFDPKVAAQAVMAETALWFNKTSAEVRADREEFAEQARGLISRVASAYGEHAQGLASQALSYAEFLRTQAASGLDQIQQTVDPHDNPKTTPLDPEVFDNFVPDIDPINQGVSGTETSERNPLLQEIMGEGGGQGTPEAPGGHSTGDDFSNSYSEVPAEDPLGQRSVAINHTASLDDFRKGAVHATDVVGFAHDGAAYCPRCHGPEDSKCEGVCGPIFGDNEAGPTGEQCSNCRDDIIRPWDQASRSDYHRHYGDDRYYDPSRHPLNEDHHTAKREVVSRHTVQGASGLDEIQQVVNPHEDPDPTPLPDDVAFPWTITPDAYGNGGEKKAAVKKQADMFGASDAPSVVPQPGVANSPATTPDAKAGYAEGRADGLAGDAPTVADGSSHVAPNVPQYGKGYADGAAERANSLPRDVPGSMASLKISASLVGKEAAEHADFRKGYGFASQWAPGKPMVSLGSAEFEAGLYAGISDNQANQAAWLEQHKAQLAAGHGDLGRRIALHTRFSTEAATKTALMLDSNGVYLKTAATTLDLNTMSDEASPAADGSTPINGPGRPGPLAGGSDPAAPGGASPYNGAEPFGSPVVPTAGVTRAPSPTDMLINDEPGGPLDGNAKALAFRRRVQSSLLSQNKN